MFNFKGFMLCIVVIGGTFSFLFGDTNISGGNVNGNWTLDGSPYLINNDIAIPNGESLVIQPGVEIRFTGHYRFNVQGSLNAIGTLADSIRFTAQDTTIGWFGIRFVNTPATNDSSRFEYCTLLHSKKPGDGSPQADYYGGGLYVANFSKLRVSCTRISYCSSLFGGAFFIEYSALNLSKSVLSFNTASHGCGGLYLMRSKGIISQNEIMHNSAPYAAGIEIHGPDLDNSKPIITGNYIHHNNAYANSSVGGGINTDSTNCIIINNYITNNEAYYGGGICPSRNSGISIINNVIANNTASYGGGICTSQDGIRSIINNTIVNNYAHGCGGGMYLNHFPQYSVIANNILWGNLTTMEQYGHQVYWQGNSSPLFGYCCVEGGTNGFNTYPNLSNCISSNPLFVAPTVGVGVNYNALEANWAIQNNSPCANVGDPDLTGFELPTLDIIGNPRINDGRVDIGAYERLLPPLIQLISSQQIQFGNNYLSTTSEPSIIVVKNIGNLPMLISDLVIGLHNEAFSVSCDSLNQQISQNGQISISLTFSPLAAVSYTDTLYVYSNSENTPILKIPLKGMGVIAQPNTTENLQLTMVNSNDALLTWADVTENVIGQPVTPDYYLVFLNGSQDYNGLYSFLGLTPNTQYTHQYVGLAADHMFYKVKAIKLYREGVLAGNLPTQDRQALDAYLSAHLRVGMTENEVTEILTQIGN